MQDSEKKQTTTSDISEIRKRNEAERVRLARATLQGAAQEDATGKAIRAALQEAAQKAKRRK